MIKTTKQYFCDRCGAEFKPYGFNYEITTSYGAVGYKRGLIDFGRIESKGSFICNSTPSFEKVGFGNNEGTGTLCPDCMDGLTAFLKNEQ